MIKAKCLQKIRDKNNHILGYKLQDINGNIREFNAKYIKEQIKAGNLEIEGISLTTDGKLIDTVHKSADAIQKRKNADKEQVLKLLQKSKLLGREPISISVSYEHNDFIYLIQQTDTNYILYIPDTIKRIDKCFDDFISHPDITVKVIGGGGLRSTNNMFRSCRFKELDLSSFDTHNIKDMSDMFNTCKIQLIDFTNFDTSNVTNMTSMFHSCDVPCLDLSRFNTSNVACMTYMFALCKSKSINLSSFDTHMVSAMNNMFDGCCAEELDLTSFNTQRVTDMEEMFQCCRASFINLSSFSMSNVKKSYNMFNSCYSQIKASDTAIIKLISRKQLVK